MKMERLDDKINELVEERGALWAELEEDLHVDDTNHSWRAEKCAKLASIELEIDALEARKAIAQLIYHS